MTSTEGDESSGLGEYRRCAECGERHVAVRRPLDYCSLKCAQKLIDAERIAEFGPPMSTKAKVKAMALAFTCVFLVGYTCRDQLLLRFETKSLVAVCVLVAAAITDAVNNGFDPESFTPAVLRRHDLSLKATLVLLWLQMLFQIYSAHSNESVGLLALWLVIGAPFAAIWMLFELGCVALLCYFIMTFLRGVKGWR